ncbi:unnamed protein product [Choristocarpus tenellus]
MPPTEAIDCVVVGAGVIGIAVARALALRGRQVLVCERESKVGQGITSRSSEVIHAGIYYPRGSLKASLCVRGREDLYRFCEERSVAHKRCGKLLVAASAQERARLREISASAQANGVKDLRWIDRSEAHEMEPDVRCDSALLSPSTGIVDSHGLVLALQGEAEAHGTEVCLNTPVIGATVLPVSTKPIHNTCDVLFVLCIKLFCSFRSILASVSKSSLLLSPHCQLGNVQTLHTISTQPQRTSSWMLRSTGL